MLGIRAIRSPLLAAALLLAGGTSALGAAKIVNPSTSISLSSGAIPTVCYSDPNGAACENAAIAALDAGRTATGLAPYVLPSDFLSLQPTVQLFILTNLDRIAYGVHPVAGLNSVLDANSATAVRNDEDPGSPPSGFGLTGWSSNWAGGFENALWAYYGWVYDDGLGSGNLDCTATRSSGCWGHRDNILFTEDSATAVMGAAVGNDTSGTVGYASQIVAATVKVAYEYTWEQALADGAGGSAAISSTPAPAAPAAAPTAQAQPKAGRAVLRRAVVERRPVRGVRG